MVVESSESSESSSSSEADSSSDAEEYDLGYDEEMEQALNEVLYYQEPPSEKGSEDGRESDSPAAKKQKISESVGTQTEPTLAIDETVTEVVTNMARWTSALAEIERLAPALGFSVRPGHGVRFLAIYRWMDDEKRRDPLEKRPGSH